MQSVTVITLVMRYRIDVYIKNIANHCQEKNTIYNKVAQKNLL